MKKLKLLLVAIVFAVTANAQIQIGVSGSLGLPMGDFGDAAKMGIGATVTGKYALNETMTVGANIGYLSFSSDLDGFSWTIMPITALFEYNLGKFYVGSDLGFYSYGVKFEYEGIEGSSSKTYLGFAPTVGANFPINEKMSFNANAKYNVIMSDGESTSYLGINLGLLFNL